MTLRRLVKAVRDVLGQRNRGTAEIRQLGSEILEEDKKLAALFTRHAHDPAVLGELPEFCDPAIVVPQTCKRQLLVYLLLQAEGLGHKECLRAVLASRYDTNAVNPLGIRGADFDQFLTGGDITLSDLCKEILRREQNPEGSGSKQSLLDGLVDRYFGDRSEGEPGT